MKNIQKSVLKCMASVGKMTAVKAAGAASLAYMHQPKEPAALKNLKK
ncbi:MAG: cyclic lactone autoinducer peptide [Ruminococcus sp.]|nr:cyclic lactone autoinducer peptide [Ruminococcus sp.]